MVICVDIGNSSVKYALFKNGKVAGAVRRKALEGLGRRSWRSLFEPLEGLERKIQGAIIASVAPSLTPAAEAAVRRLTAHRPLIAGAHLQMPFSLDVPHPNTVGADRLCCAAGAVGGRKRDAILIDIGSAVTVDLVAKASFKGGVILAGTDLILRSLALHTEKLPKLEYRQEKGTFRRRHFNTTERSMVIGAELSVEGGIRQAVRFLEHTAGRRFPKYLTGGAAVMFIHKFPSSWQHEPLLVLKGLYRLWELNTPF